MLLEYASTAWNPQTITKIKSLESVQNKAARFVTKTYHRDASVTALKQDLDWPSLAKRRELRDCTMWYKIHYGLVLLPFPPNVVPKPRLAKDDHNLAYLRLNPRVDCYQYIFFVRTIITCNGLHALAVVARA